MRCVALICLWGAFLSVPVSAFAAYVTGQCIHISDSKDRAMPVGVYRVTVKPGLMVEREKAVYIQLYDMEKGLQRAQIATMSDLAGVQITPCPKDAALASVMASQLEGELARLNLTIGSAFPQSCPAGYTIVPRDLAKSAADIPPIIMTLECAGGPTAYFDHLTMTTEGTSRVAKTVGTYRATRDCSKLASRLTQAGLDDVVSEISCANNKLSFSQVGGLEVYPEPLRTAYINFYHLVLEQKRGVKWTGVHTVHDLVEPIIALFESRELQERITKAAPTTKLLVDGIRRNFTDERTLNAALANFK